MRRFPSYLAILLALLAALGLAGATGAGPSAAALQPLAPETGAPTVVSYQGHLTVGDSPYTGTGYFKFAVVDASGTTVYWSNNGLLFNGVPTEAVVLPVNGGLFGVLLGDTDLTNMTALPVSAFADTERWLRVWFSADGVTFAHLEPDRRFAAAPYALQAAEAANADTLDGVQGSAYQLRVSGVCEAGSMIAINADGSVICGGLPVEPAVSAGSALFTTPALNFALVRFSLDATHICPPGGSCPPTIYHLSMVHELDGNSPVLFARMAQGGVFQEFTLLVEQPGRDLAYLKLDALQVMVASVATERGPGVGPLETITLSFQSTAPLVWTPTGEPIPGPEEFPGQERVGTLTLDTTAPLPVTVPVFGHEWSASGGTVSASFGSLIVTTLLDASAPQIQTWLDTAATRPTAQLDLFTPGATDVMATYQLGDFSIIGAEQWASGNAGEPAFNKVTLNYTRIRETVGTATFCWDLETNSECS